MKPYRLINQSEIKAISLQLAPMKQVLNQYITQCDLQLTQQECHLDKACVTFSDNQSVLAVIDSNDCEPLAQRVLNSNEESSLYRQFAIEMMTQALKAFFTIDKLITSEQQQAEHDWIYPGAPNLSLELVLDDYRLAIALNPKWVAAQLSPISHSPVKLMPARELLTAQQVSLSAKLTTFNCSLNTLMQLKIGDVIQTTHRVSDPIELVAKGNHLIAIANLGHTNNTKALQFIEENNHARD